MKKIAIVYFAFINHKKNWRKIIYSQLSDIKRSGVLDEASLYIEVSDPDDSPCVKEFFNNLDIPHDGVNFHSKNAYEYYGIHKVWELAVNNKHEFLIYLHTKGMSYKQKFSFFGLKSGRNPREIVLTYLTFLNFRNTLKIFDTQNTISKIGAFPKKDYDPNDKRGCLIWFNFFWVRASYVRELEEPIVTTDRFYYEDWLAKDDEHGDAYKRITYSLYKKTNEGYDVTSASDIVKKLNKIYKWTWPISALYIKFMLQKYSR